MAFTPPSHLASLIEVRQLIRSVWMDSNTHIVQLQLTSLLICSLHTSIDSLQQCCVCKFGYSSEQQTAQNLGQRGNDDAESNELTCAATSYHLKNGAS